MAGKFKLSGPLEANLAREPMRQKAAIVAAAEYTAPQIESFMRSEARWTDRTGNARNGLRTKVYVSNDKVSIVAYHSVPYGPYLELRWGGKYGIILDAIAAGGPLFLEACARLMFKE